MQLSRKYNFYPNYFIAILVRAKHIKPMSMLLTIYVAIHNLLKKAVLLPSLYFALSFCFIHTKAKGQVFFDSLYATQEGTKSFTHLYLYPNSDSALVVSTVYNLYTNDSDLFSHVFLYMLNTKDGSLKQLQRIQQNYWDVSTGIGFPFEPEESRIYYGMIDTSERDWGKYKTIYYMIATTSDNWKTITSTKLQIPFRSYFVKGHLKTKTGYILVGDTGVFDISPAYVASYDLNFKLNWVKSYPFQCGFKSILPTNTGYILSGTKNFGYNRRAVQLHIDSLGEITWQRDFSDTVYLISGFMGQGIQLGNKYINYGYVTDIKNLYYKGFLSITNAQGEIELERFYPHLNKFMFINMIESNGSIYAIADMDTLYTPDTMSSVVHFSKISPETGKMEWFQIYKHWSMYNDIHKVYKTEDGFILCGNAMNQNRLPEFDSLHPPQVDAWILKVDTNGCIVPGCKPNIIEGIQHILHDNALIEVFPNPVQRQFQINLKSNLLTQTENQVYIYDECGKELFSNTYSKGQNVLLIERNFTYSGMAFLVLKNSNGSFYKKVLFL